MRLLILAACLFLSFRAVSAEPECTFDQASQLEVLKGVMKKYPGGTLDAAQRKINWTKSNVITEYQYGGCAHLGATILTSEERAKPRSEKETFRIAKELAQKYLDSTVVEVLAQAMQAKTFRIDNAANIVTYHIDHETYSMFYLEHRHESNRETIKVSWLGNY